MELYWVLFASITILATTTDQDITILTLTSIGYLAVLFYLISWLLISYNIRVKNVGSLRVSSIVVWLLAIISHAIYLYTPLFGHQGLELDIVSASSQVTLLTNLILFITIFSRRVEILALFLQPAAIITLILQLSQITTHQSIQINGPLAIHIVFSLLGYSTLFLATLQALLLSVQNRHLHNHQPGGIIRSLPALQDMEHLLFKLILTGVILLSAGLITGFIFLDNLFGTQVMHKTVLSIIAWLVYTTLLIGHWRQGWRGRKAVAWTITAFILLILAFFGSKFVQEILLTK